MAFGGLLVPWMESFGQFLSLNGNLHSVFCPFLQVFQRGPSFVSDSPNSKMSEESFLNLFQGYCFPQTR